jgi:hypothetical protein
MQNTICKSIKTEIFILELRSHCDSVNPDTFPRKCLLEASVLSVPPSDYHLLPTMLSPLSHNLALILIARSDFQIFNQSLLSMFGLIFGGKLESMAGTTGVTTVMSLNCTISNFSGFLISPLSKYFSTKQITQIGVLLVSAGMVLSTYTKSYTRVTLGYGVLTGKLPSFFELFKYLRSLAICGFFFL